jgi:hypothetical protein
MDLEQMMRLDQCIETSRAISNDIQALKDDIVECLGGEAKVAYDRLMDAAADKIRNVRTRLQSLQNI